MSRSTSKGFLMKLRPSTLSAVLAFSTIGWAHAQSLPPSLLSDRLLITNAAGQVLFDKSLIEQAGQTETLIYNPPLPVDACVLTAQCNAVALLEPLNEPIEANETPIYVQTPIGRRIVSDYILSFPSAAGRGVELVSDGDPTWTALASSLKSSNVAFIEETGKLQDLTALLKTPFRVQVQSDVAAVPEAQSFLLMLLGLTGVALAARRREN